jgi:hypothetical protein
MTWLGDKTHNQDYIDSAIVKHGWQKAFHEKYPVAYPYMHFHVYDETNLKKLISFMFEDATIDVIKNEKYSDNIILFRNKLKPAFLEKYKDLIAAYSKFIESDAKKNRNAFTGT